MITTVQPFFSCLYSPINELARFLDRLLRPLVEDACRSTIFPNGADFIRQLKAYVTSTQGRFHPQTLLATFQIRDFYFGLSHDRILDSLGRFLVKKLPGNRLENLTIITLEYLTELFLKNHFFYYNHVIYHCRKGSPRDFSFTETLGNIYLLEWQDEHLLNNPLMTREFYRRLVFFFSLILCLLPVYM